MNVLLYSVNVPVLGFLLVSLGVSFFSVPANSIASISRYVYVKALCVLIVLCIFNYLVWMYYPSVRSVEEGYPPYLYYVSPVIFFLSVSLCVSIWEHWYGDCVDIENNPAVFWDQMPDFSKITPQLLEKGCLYALRETPKRWKSFMKVKSKKNISDFLYALEEIFKPASKVLSVLHHLHSVNDSGEIRKIHEKYAHQFDPLFRKTEHFPEVKTFYDDRKSFSPVLAKIVGDIYDGLVDIGANLSSEDRKKYLALCEKSQKLGTTFSQNLLDETQSYELWLQKSDLDGLSDDFISLLRQSNVSKKLQEEEKFWKVSLSPPVVTEFLTYSKRADLREKLYRKYASRATSGKRDNTPIIKNILDARFNIAQMLGYSDYGSYSLRTEMAGTTQTVFDFLQGIQDKSFSKAMQEYVELQNLKQEMCGDADVHPWDFAYFSEILKKKKYDISSEITRPYFPKEKVLEGLFSILGELFGFSAVRQQSEKGWHPAVLEYFLVSQRSEDEGKQIGKILFDLYAREGKRSGGWMGHFSSRHKDSMGNIQHPVAYIVCNFRPPLQGEDAYLTFDEIETLFHEVGHALHHVLTLQDHQEVSGIAGVPHDAVEFPSQFMENWLWQEKTLQMISSHKTTKESVPREMVARLKESKTFQSGLFLVRQIYFGMMDMEFHTKFCVLRKEMGSADHIDVRKISKEIASKVLPYEIPDFACFENTFSHIFDGGYEVGYYGYLWAEVLAADAFEYFEKNGVFNQKLGEKFRNVILGGGGSKPFMELYREFRERDPVQSAFLKQMGIN